MRYNEAVNYCKDHFNGQLATIESEVQLRKANQIVAQGFAMEGFLATDREWTEMWVGGNTNAELNSVVDANTVGSGKMI